MLKSILIETMDRKVETCVYVKSCLAFKGFNQTEMTLVKESIKTMEENKVV